MIKLSDTLLKPLADAAGVSGAEDEVRRLIVKHIRPYVEDLRIDSMGNILAVKKGTGESDLRILVAAHMDEVGFMVTGIDSNGMLQVKNVGGVDARILPSLRVKVGKQKLPGVFCWKPIHLNRGDDVVSIDNMRVDIGATSKSAAQSKVQLGDRIVFDSEVIEMNDVVIRGKAFDDRAGCAELIEIIKGDPFPFDLLVAFTVQEEVGLRGASVLGEALRPDAAIVLECTACHEVPQPPEKADQTTVTKLGHGPVISYMDRTSIAHVGLRRHFTQTAEANGIPHQFRSPQFAGGTDAGIIHKSIHGIPSQTISLPGRYLHTPHIMMSMEDFSNGVKLVRAALQTLSADVLEIN
ncbi:MAG: peptidase M42 [Phototrophicales bacterium]|nr:MAG: peptidase M42 [Phototrophicales bacterium]